MSSPRLTASVPLAALLLAACNTATSSRGGSPPSTVASSPTRVEVRTGAGDAACGARPDASAAGPRRPRPGLIMAFMFPRIQRAL
jgi:hypothetical protein